jgi:hypothetical protein
MSLFRKAQHSTFFIRLRNWEYWPFGIVQFPVIIYWLWLSVRARSLVFFSASNPSIVLGGMFGESKFEVLRAVPSHLKPKTILIKWPATPSDVMQELAGHGLRFPLIFKPDLGERGFMVKRIYSFSEMQDYVERINADFIIQEFVDLPVECGVFYARFPHEQNGQVTSLVLKEMLAVTGNGTSSVEDLILQQDRARLQYNRLQKTHNGVLRQVLPSGQKLELNSIGNHCLGTKFIDGSVHLSGELSASFDRICKELNEFYFGRIDLRCASLEHLKRGEVQIMEVNGCGAEPGHIYHPGFPLRKAISVLFAHWRTIYEISVQNQKRGYPYTSLKECLRIYRSFRSSLKGARPA